ncbi:MAG: DNA ligase D [Propylenella sp.]
MAPRKLETYRKKRDFRVTSEPVGVETGEAGNLFMIHKHDATRLHYDLRLQIGDVLKSWAVPKGPSLDPGERRLAVEVEEHPLEYGAFEGVIPESQYGAGPTLIWDSGTWAPMGDLEKSLKSGTLKFRLAGEKLKGGWTLVRLKQRPGDKQPSWLLIKEHDDAASTEGDILDDRPESVASGKLIEDLLKQPSAVWSSGKKATRQTKRVEIAEAPKPAKPVELRPGTLKGARKAPLPRTFKPQLASTIDSPPTGEGWLHEIKLDGYRTIAIVGDGKAKLITRNGHDWTDRYGDVAKAFEALPCGSAIIDGEVVVPDAQGITRFGALQDAIAVGETWKMIFYAFDLMYLNGYDLTDVPLIERKALLEKLIRPFAHISSALQLSDHVVGHGAEFFKQASEMQLEGVVSKRVNSAYRSERTKTWVKAKARQSGTFTIVGYTTSKAAGGLAALHLAENGPEGLRAVGKVGTGFSAAEAAALAARLQEHARAKPAVHFAAPTPKAVWVEPVLKARIQYSDKTGDGNLRHAVFQGLQEPESGRSGPKVTERFITDQHLASIWVTNPERRMFSKDGPTKLDLAVYYARVGDYMLPHIVNRPVSLVRNPTGKEEDSFFQRHVFSGMPPEIGIFPSRKADEEERDYLFVKDAEGYLALAQFGVVEFHPWGCRVDKPERPDRMFFDLDPGEGLRWRDIVAAAETVRTELTHLGLVPFVKTSGGKGLHVVVPINRRHTWKELHQTSGKIAALLAKKFPATFLTSMAKKERANRIFVDFHRNARSATSVGAYSLRARKGLPASAPLSWEDLRSIDGPADLNYATLPGFLSNSGDPWAEMDASACSLGKDLADKLAS